VEEVRQTLQATEPVPRRHSVAELFAPVCVATGCHAPALQHGSPRAPAARTKKGIAYLVVEVCGYPASAVADRLGGHPSAVYRAAGTRWDRLLAPHTLEKNIRTQRMAERSDTLRFNSACSSRN